MNQPTKNDQSLTLPAGKRTRQAVCVTKVLIGPQETQNDWPSKLYKLLLKEHAKYCVPICSHPGIIPVAINSEILVSILAWVRRGLLKGERET